MGHHYKSEQEIMNELEIEDWRHMSRDKIVRFASSLHKMDPEVAKKALDQVPNFVSYAGDVLKVYKETITEVAKLNNKNSEIYFEVCNSIITRLQRELDREELTFEERHIIIEDMVDLANKMQIENKENRAFWGKLMGGLLAVVVFLGSLIAAALGAFSNHDDDDIDMVA